MNLFNAASFAALVSSSIGLAPRVLLGSWARRRQGLAASPGSPPLPWFPQFPATWTAPGAHPRSARSLLALHICAWIVYLEGWGRQRLRRLDWLVLAAVAGLGALAFIPGAMYRDELALRSVRWMGLTYRDPILTPSGTVIAVFLNATGLARLARAGRIAREGAPGPRVHLVAGVFVLALAIHDTAIVCGLQLGTPSLLDVGFLVPILLMAAAGTCRLVGHARELERLKTRLEEAVVERTRELERAQVALARAERLAALGQFSAGVAHEVNNPAAAISANLDHLKAQLGADLRRDLSECLDDSVAAVERISLTRRLLVAGAPRPSSLQPVAVDLGDRGRGAARGAPASDPR
jgi:signal transduction histidine kinase